MSNIVLSGLIWLPEAKALARRMQVQPSSRRMRAINNVFDGFRKLDLLSKIDAFGRMDAADSQAAKLNWIADQYNLTETNSPAFVADQGYTGDGSTSYLRTGFNPTTAVSPKYTQNSATLGVGIRTNTTTGFDMGARTGGASAQSILATRNANLALFRPNLDVTSVSAASTDSIGGWIATRTASNVWVGYKNGAAVANGTDVSAAPANLEFFLGAVNTAGSPVAPSARQMTWWLIASAFTATDAANFNTIMNAYSAAVGS